MIMSASKTYIRPGETLQLGLPYSEVCMHMGVAGSVMTVLLTVGDFPMAQLIRDGRPFSFPIGTGEAGLYSDEGGYYGYPAPDPRTAETWTDETDAEAAVFFPTLPEREIRRRQDLCKQQMRLAWEQRNEQASANLQRMSDALTREMFRRTAARGEDS
jgi:hypothetical protein